MATRRQLEERQAQARLDLAEIDDQLAAGELDQATGDALRDRYRREIETAAAQAATVPDQPVGTGRSVPRIVIGTVVMTAAIAAIVFLAAGALDDRQPGQFATGNIESRDLSEISTAEMEQVVADFPNVVDMRLALARRYFEAVDYSSALPHYLAVVQQDPTNPEANANLGWMTFVSDPEQSETAAAFLERALTAAPGYSPATFYLANVRLYGLDDPAGARPLLDQLLELDDLPEDVAAAIETMVSDTGGRS